MAVVWRWLPVVAWSAVILVASDDHFSAERSASWFQAMFGRELPHALHVLIRKLAHLVEYAILGALAFRAARGGGRRYTIAIAIALFVAAVDETRQSLTVSRTGTPWDVLIDLAGATAGAFANTSSVGHDDRGSGMPGQ